MWVRAGLYSALVEGMRLVVLLLPPPPTQPALQIAHECKVCAIVIGGFRMEPVSESSFLFYLS